jgi:hypothetical protein
VDAGAFGFFDFQPRFARVDQATGVERFRSVPSRNSVSAKDSEPTLQGHPRTASFGLRKKFALTQPVNHNGRRAAIPEECKISQNCEIAPMQITLYPRARCWSL